MSAHPRLKANRASARGGGRKKAAAAAADDDAGRIGGAGGVRRSDTAPGPPEAVSDSAGGVSKLRRDSDRAVEEGGGGPVSSWGFDRGDDLGSSSLGDSLEPGQACSPLRYPWHGSAGDVGVGGHNRAGGGGGDGGGGGGGGLGLGPSWLRQRAVEGCEDTASSAGEASSGAELGEAAAADVFDQHFDGFSADGGRGRENRASRPLVALKVGAGSPASRRWAVVFA